MAMNHNINADDMLKLLRNTETSSMHRMYKGLDLSAVATQLPPEQPSISALQIQQVMAEEQARNRRDRDTVDATRRLESAVSALHDQIERLCGLLETLQLSVVGRKGD